MEIKIAHLYYDLMNLYGENGNIKALTTSFERQGIKVKVDTLSVNDKIDFNYYDIYYMGSGSEDNQLFVLKDLIKYKNDIKNSTENNKFFFMTGNSFELFGKYIIDFEENKIECLKIFEYYTKVTSIKKISSIPSFRVVGEIKGYTNLISDCIIGFQNRSGVIYDSLTPFLTLKMGTGNKPKDVNEGFKYKNFYGTYTIGPLFIRNPHLTDYFVKKIILQKDKSFKYKIIKNTPEIVAYNKYLENFPI